MYSSALDVPSISPIAITAAAAPSRHGVPGRLLPCRVAPMAAVRRSGASPAARLPLRVLKSNRLLPQAALVYALCCATAMTATHLPRRVVSFFLETQATMLRTAAIAGRQMR